MWSQERSFPTGTPASLVAHVWFCHLHHGKWKVLMGQSHVLAPVSGMMIQNLQATKMDQHFFLS